ncbi:hypothetical protein G6L35_22940 [Agrobacterium tumefaciens]|uniref:hypothetical protein n=1 Tax=Agrobacterium tumefaciens TaxID=358 RepID=UPI0015721141|nr:hypothetical protein [Agrobacterium tumefaciens]NSZ71501.1 hypothetical protein [Agrobacterium tumefaciens]
MQSISQLEKLRGTTELPGVFSVLLSSFGTCTLSADLATFYLRSKRALFVNSIDCFEVGKKVAIESGGTEMKTHRDLSFLAINFTVYSWQKTREAKRRASKDGWADPPSF